MEKYYSIGQVSKIIGVTVKTVRRWEESGKLEPDTRTAGNHRRYSEIVLRQFLGKPLPEGESDKKIILYARVKRKAQKDELNHQVETLKQYTIASGQWFDDVWTDYGSGLNYRREKFQNLLKLALNGQLDKVIITHQDRLVRFGYELIEDLFNECGTQIVRINRSEKPELMPELAEDLIAIVQDFCVKSDSQCCKEAKKLAQQLAECLTDA